MNVVDATYDCPRCGCTELLIYTDEPQDQDEMDRHGREWMAAEGDPVQCPECGAMGSVVVDVEDGWICMDED